MIDTEEVRALLRLLAGNDRAGERWPLLRTGAREPIPWYVRYGVFERDGGQCCACGVPLSRKTAQLDHIIPWSAGGSDASENLRLLCEPCNSDRSNFHGWLDTWGAKRLPVAFWCAGCVHHDDDCEEAAGEVFPAAEDMPLAYCVECGLTSRTWAEACR